MFINFKILIDDEFLFRGTGNLVIKQTPMD